MNTCILKNKQTNKQTKRQQHGMKQRAIASNKIQIITKYKICLFLVVCVDREVMVSRIFDRGSCIHTCTYDPKGAYLGQSVTVTWWWWWWGGRGCSMLIVSFVCSFLAPEDTGFCVNVLGKYSSHCIQI